MAQLIGLGRIVERVAIGATDRLTAEIAQYLGIKCPSESEILALESSCIHWIAIDFDCAHVRRSNDRRARSERQD